MNPLINLANRHYRCRSDRRKLNLRIRVNGRDRSSVDEFILFEECTRGKKSNERKGEYFSAISARGTVRSRTRGGAEVRRGSESAGIILIFAITRYAARQVCLYARLRRTHRKYYLCYDTCVRARMCVFRAHRGLDFARVRSFRIASCLER